tara:strand:- start:968 stop:1210 length:243 start_codon:yes stop_codon:yes gene_type:complete
MVAENVKMRRTNKMTEKRTWQISWFIWNGGKGVKTKSVLKTVDPADYPDRYSEREQLRDEAYYEYDLHPDKMVMIKEVTQ